MKYRTEIQPDQMHEGDILIGHGLVFSPAFLLEKKVSLDEGRLLDSSTLINALALHDRLITLPAGIPSNIRDTRLYRYLTDNEILCY